MCNAIHKYALDGDYFVIDPASGAVHVADKYAYDLLDKVRPAYFERYEGLEGGCYKELRDLYKNGLLFSVDDCEPYAETHIDVPLKALCLHVSHNCNLRCVYCFAEDVIGDACGKCTTMSPETAVAAIDFLVANSGERVDLEADFFGGEPLMAWDTVKAAVDYARANEAKWGKSFRFTITTNGLLLDDDKIDYINANMSNCVLSLDGRKAVNDRHRPTPNGNGSFDLVIDKFRKLVAARDSNPPNLADWYVRGTFTAYNLDFAEDVIELVRLGFRNISLEPVTADTAVPHAIKHEHLSAIYEQYERLFRLMKSGELNVTERHVPCSAAEPPTPERLFTFFHFCVDLTGGPCVIRRLRGCGCGNEYLAVAPDGSAYPCHRFVGDDKWKMGNVSGASLDVNIKSYFAKTHIYSKPQCRTCWARFYCSGGCNASSYECYGDCRVTDQNSIECLMMKRRLECAIALAALKI